MSHHHHHSKDENMDFDYLNADSSSSSYYYGAAESSSSSFLHSSSYSAEHVASPYSPYSSYAQQSPYHQNAAVKNEDQHQHYTSVPQNLFGTGQAYEQAGLKGYSRTFSGNDLLSDNSSPARGLRRYNSDVPAYSQFGTYNPFQGSPLEFSNLNRMENRRYSSKTCFFQIQNKTAIFLNDEYYFS